MTKFELAAAIVVHRNRVLVVRRSEKESFLPNHWGIPCGKIDVDRGESAEDAVLRELCEETGLTGTIVSHVGQSEFTSPWRGGLAQNIQQNYLVRPRAGGLTRVFRRWPEITTPQPDQLAKWVPMAQIDAFGLDDHNLGAINQWRVRAAMAEWRLRICGNVDYRDRDRFTPVSGGESVPITDWIRNH